MKYIIIILFSGMLVLAGTGCKKLDLAPTDRFSDLTFWTVNENVSNALNNNYSLMYNSNLYFYNDALSDNQYSNTGRLQCNCSRLLHAKPGEIQE